MTAVIKPRQELTSVALVLQQEILWLFGALRGLTKLCKLWLKYT